MKYVVGVDGGGTKCRARICDENGFVLGEGESGSANILLGANLAMRAIIEAITKAAKVALLGEEQFPFMDVGLALAAAEQKSSWLEFMASPHPFASLVLNTDGYGACLGAHNGENGGIVIAGTGSVGLMINNGDQTVIGGREFPISDQGGGARMGLRAIQESLLAYDGIRKSTGLAEHIISNFNHDIDSLVQWSKSAKPCDYGQFSPAIFSYEAKGDPLAVELLLETQTEIERLILTLIKKGATEVCLMGGIGERLKKRLPTSVQAYLRQPKADAMSGALMMAGKKEHNLF